MRSSERRGRKIWGFLHFHSAYSNPHAMMQSVYPVPGIAPFKVERHGRTSCLMFEIRCEHIVLLLLV